MVSEHAAASGIPTRRSRKQTKAKKDDSDSSNDDPPQKKMKGLAELFAVNWKVSFSSQFRVYLGLNSRSA